MSYKILKIQYLYTIQYILGTRKYYDIISMKLHINALMSDAGQDALTPISIMIINNN